MYNQYISYVHQEKELIKFFKQIEFLQFKYLRI